MQVPWVKKIVPSQTILVLKVLVQELWVTINKRTTYYLQFDRKFATVTASASILKQYYLNLLRIWISLQFQLQVWHYKLAICASMTKNCQFANSFQRPIHLDVTNDGSGWRKGVVTYVSQCLEFGSWNVLCTYRRGTQALRSLHKCGLKMEKMEDGPSSHLKRNEIYIQSLKSYISLPLPNFWCCDFRWLKLLSLHII